MDVLGAQSTYIRNYNSNSGRGRVPAYIRQKTNHVAEEAKLANTKNTLQTANIKNQSITNLSVENQTALSFGSASSTSQTDSTYQKKTDNNRRSNAATSSSIKNYNLHASDYQEDPVSSLQSTAKNSKDDVSEDEDSTETKKETESQKQEVEELKARDNEVRIHEAQHKSAGGSYAQSPSFSYTTGPDGHQYITDGSVSISLSEESTPENTIKKMEQVHRAALAPAEPSEADRSVAAEAIQIANQAREKLLHENLNGSEDEDSTELKMQSATDKNSKNSSSEAANESNEISTNGTIRPKLDFTHAGKVISKRYNASSQYSMAGSGINILG